MDPRERIIVAIDTSSPFNAFELVSKLSPHVGCFKIGLEFMTSALADLLFSCGDDHAINSLIWWRSIIRDAGNIFWDGKFNDIPNTVAAASCATRSMGVKFFNVHALSGVEAVREAAKNKGDAKLLVVTVLTSLQFADLWNIGLGRCRNANCRKYATTEWSEKFVNDLVENMALWAKGCGADGIICSPRELPLFAKDKTFDGFIKVVPGVRPKWAVANDQKRFMTPREAILAGADYLVIGRPITAPPEVIDGPVEAAQKIAEEIEQALHERMIDKMANHYAKKIIDGVVRAKKEAGK